MKVILINTPKGQYYVPLKLVAEHRADYYACEVDGHERNSPEWDEEVSYGMDDDFECIDWIINNTNFEDWSDSMSKHSNDILVLEDDFWTSSDDFNIVEL